MTDRLISELHSISFICLNKDSNSGHSIIEWFRNGHPIVPLLMDRKDRHRFKISNNE